MTTTKAAAEAERGAVRRELFAKLAADYPHLPATVILNAVLDADRALWLCGHGQTERETLERACRHNLDAVTAAFARTNDDAQPAPPGPGPAGE